MAGRSFFLSIFFVVVDVGDSVAVDDLVTTLETEKVSVDVRSPVAGLLTACLAPANAVVPVGAPLGTITLGPAGATPPVT